MGWMVISGWHDALLIKTPVSYSGESDRDYPDIVSIINTDHTEVWFAHRACLGQYSKMEDKSSHGKPVWKHNDREDRFFFMGKNKFWYCSYTYGPTAGGFLSAIKTKGAFPWTIYTGPKSFFFA